MCCDSPELIGAISAPAFPDFPNFPIPKALERPASRLDPVSPTEGFAPVNYTRDWIGLQVFRGAYPAHYDVEVVGNTGQLTLDTVEVRSSSLLVPTTFFQFNK